MFSHLALSALPADAHHGARAHRRRQAAAVVVLAARGAEEHVGQALAARAQSAPVAGAVEEVGGLRHVAGAQGLARPGVLEAADADGARVVEELVAVRVRALH